MAIGLSVGDILEVTWFCRTNDGQLQATVGHYKYLNSSFGALVGLADFQAKVDLEFSTVIEPIIPTVHSYLGSIARRLWPTPSQGFPYGVNAGFGLAAGDPLPSQVAGLIKLRCDFAPPRVRGRQYVASTTETYNDASGRPTGAWVTLAEALGDMRIATQNVLDGLGGNGNFQPGTYRRVGNIFHEFTGRNVRLFWATQKRRSEINRGDAIPL